MNTFHRLLIGESSGILSIYGHSGTGKSELLMHYRLKARDKGVPFYLVNAQFTKADPSSFLQALLEQMGPPSPSVSPLEAIRMHMQHLEKKGIHFVIAIDSYEHYEKLDEWFRQSFLPSLPSSIIFIFCGRNPLNTYWKSSIWHPFIQTIELQALTYEQFNATIETSTEAQLKKIWHCSKGNPFAISHLIYSSNKEGKLDDRLVQATYQNIVREWLREVTNDRMLPYIEAASFGVQIHQEKIEAILTNTLSRKEFEQLISYSFVEETETGWKLHPLFHHALKMDLIKRKPTYYHELWKRALMYCRTYMEQHDHVIKTNDINEFFYLLKERMVQSSPFNNENISMYSMASAHAEDWTEIQPFLMKDKEYFREGENSYLSLEALKEIGLRYVKLLRNEAGKVRGMAVMIPIQSSTLELLKTNPVTKSYFYNLSSFEEKRVRKAKLPCGWVIRYLNIIDKNKKEELYALLYHLLPLVLTEGILVASTPVAYYQSLLERFRFKEIPEASHNDYGSHIRSKTYELDLKNNRLPQYLDTFAQAIGVTLNSTPLDRFQFTPREKEVATLVIQGKSNATIANELSLTEITVKKHLTRIYAKLDIKNRTELTKIILGGRVN
ncbi:LuxR C-terminal-related transcriptional regulator [Guptibacillus algicola]|uniref:LuxR C-terminal-related transcriptional regulator n=1 Tax=Guptibacillus algicola TaxID=225844 RepID=UPI001CD6B143|nr:LuxR C-terminal-related transcriptional regulator [Alkalihalobacillus algicola]MCA0986903.1 LuxR C-terminal-related transcriptional regulator [Alkalihalobacillus algicola]